MVKHDQEMTSNHNDKNQSDLINNIENYYNSNFSIFNRVFGNTIQVFQPIETSLWLSYLRETIDIENGHHILDAGCGNCIPAINFAKYISCHITAITISQKQFEQSKINIEKQNLKGEITVLKGDFHRIDTLFPNNQFDRIYFLESIGHSNEKKALLQKLHQVLKEDGLLYIQDLFFDYGFSTESINKIKSIEKPSHYYVEEISNFLQMCSEMGFTPIKCINLSSEFADEIRQKNSDWESKSDLPYTALENAYCSYIYGMVLKKT